MMNLYNQKFRDKATDLRLETFKTLPCLLLFYDNKVICYRNGESHGFLTMNLELYDRYKIIAHSLVFYSMKHKQNYRKLVDVCSSLQKGIFESLATFNILPHPGTKRTPPNIQKDFPDQNYTEEIHSLKELTIDELMQKASEVFLAELHRIVQDFKKNVFNGIWPSPLLAIVAGPSSPRIGHPAMQYFSWLTKKKTTFDEMSLHGICTNAPAFSQVLNTSDQQDGINHVEPTKRFLYYVENPQNIVQALQIGLGLYVEETVYSTYKNMNTDILAQVSHDYLKEKCKPAS